MTDREARLNRILSTCDCGITNCRLLTCSREDLIWMGTELKKAWEIEDRYAQIMCEGELRSSEREKELRKVLEREAVMREALENCIQYAWENCCDQYYQNKIIEIKEELAKVEEMK